MNIDVLAFGKDRAIDLLANFKFAGFFGGDSRFQQYLRGLDILLLEVTEFGFAEAAFFALTCTELKGGIAVTLFGFDVHHCVG